MAGMKALLISTLISASDYTPRPTNVDQMHVWFNGAAAHTECNRTEKEIHFGVPTTYGNEKVSYLKSGAKGTVKRITQCIKFN